MGDIDFLSADDWRTIYLFMTAVQVPFMHRIIAEAAKREGVSKERLQMAVHGFKLKKAPPKRRG